MIKKGILLAAAVAALGARPAVAGCGGGLATVNPGAGNFQAAINAISGANNVALAGDYCLTVAAGTYAEAVVITSITTNGFRLVISTATGAAPVVTGASGNPAFTIKNVGVSVVGFTIAPTAASAYGIVSTSDSVTLSNLTITDSAGPYTQAAVFLASNTLVANSTITIGAASAFVASGSSNTIQFSSMTNNGSAQTVIFLANASSNVITNSGIGNLGGSAVLVSTRSHLNSIAFSTVVALGAGPAVAVNGSSNTSITYSYISGPSALFISNSTGSVVNSNRIAGAVSGSYSLFVAGNVGFSMSSNTVSGPGNGLALEKGNKGQIIVSTNTFLTAFGASNAGILITEQATGPAAPVIWITSNTIVPNFGTSNDIYGIKMSGLATGATVQNNGIHYRNSGSMAGMTAYGIYALNSSKLTIDRNRISAPGTITAGSITGVLLDGVTLSSVTFNDVMVKGTGLTNAYALSLVNVNSGIGARNNILASSVTVSGTAALINAPTPTPSASGFDYNDLYSFNAGFVGVWGAVGYSTLATWRTATGQDANSIAVDPRWANPAAEDFHVLSRRGRYSNGAFVQDTATSQTIDSADPAESQANEAAPTDKANQGSYGNTPEASKSDRRLQLLLPGESLVTHTATGRTGAVTITSGTAFTAAVTLVNQNWAAVGTGVDNVSVSQTLALPSTNLPATGALVSGFKNFTSLIFSSAAATMSLAATDASDSNVISDTSTAFAVFAIGGSSPAVTIAGIPVNSIKTTMNGAIAGTASDGSAISYVKVAVQLKSNGQFLDWGALTFTGGTTPQYGAATLSAPSSPNTGWSISLPDSPFNLPVPTSFYVVVVATNPSNNQSVAETTFTFNSTLLNAGATGDGQGTAYVSTNSATACQVVLSSIVFRAGAGGVGVGGLIAVHIPDGWTLPRGILQNSVLAAPPTGFVNIISTTSFSVDLNPPAEGNSTLGANWIVYKVVNVADKVTPGQQISFIYSGFATGGLRTFSIQTQGGGTGNLLPISSSPYVNLNAGPAAALSFSPSQPLSLGPLQTSPTMQIVTTDQCGVSTPTANALTVTLFASTATGTQDSGATFFQSAGAALTFPFQVTVPANSNASSSFYYNTSNTSTGFELLNATATLGGIVAPARRSVQLYPTVISLTSVSIDTGTSGNATSATMPPNGFTNPIFINFTVPHPNISWELFISTDSVNFSRPVVHRFGYGNPGRSLIWNGINEKVYPNQFVPPGTYYVKILVQGGVAVDKTLSVKINPTASIYGTVSSTGASAQVFAIGPGTNYGNFGVASSTGYFQIFGLQAGVKYNIQASTFVLVSGQISQLTASSNNIVAQLGGTDAGSIPFPTPSTLRVSVTLPFSAPKDLFGRVFINNSDYSRTAYGAIHFSSGSSSSDDGAQNFGSSASTWSLVALPPGTYDVSVNIYELSLSTKILSLSVSGITDQTVALTKKATVYGYAVLPGTVTYGTGISIQGLQKGQKVPTAFTGAFIQGANAGITQTSATYALFGLDAGTWTLTARTGGFVSVSSTVYISSSADVGNALTGGFDLFLQKGGVITGTVTVKGNSMALVDGQPGQPGFDLFINAYNPVTFTRSDARVRVFADAVLAYSTFTLTGLENGAYFVTARAFGFQDASQSVTVAGGQGAASLTLAGNSAQIKVTVKLPGSPTVADYAKVAVLVAGSGVTPFINQNLTLGNTIQYHASSATWISPPLGPGFYRFDAFDGATGVFKSVNVPLRNGTTAQLVLDLTGPTYAVQGSVSMTGAVSFASATYSVSVSSIPGLLANAAATSYCLLGQSLPFTTSTAHIELLPINTMSGNFLSGSLYVSTSPTTGCANVRLPNMAGNDPNPLLGYIAVINPDGTFQFPKVTPGIYLLRNNAEIDGDPTNGDELPQIRQVLSVNASTAGLTISLDSGLSLSGNLILPVQTALSRAFGVNLLDGSGNLLRSQVVNFNNANTAAYEFTKIPNGNYAISVSDLGYPRSYAARPVLVKALGLNVTQDIQLVQTGAIKGKLAIQQRLPDGTTGPFLLVSQPNVTLLPKGYQIQAKANPWFQGGFSGAKTSCGNAPGANVNTNSISFNCPISIDGSDQFTIDNLLPGVYDVIFQSRNQASDISEGGINLVSTILPGITVVSGRIAEAGTVNLVSSLELRGQVVDVVTSTPLANIPVVARPSNRAVQTRDTPRATTDLNGNYVLSGLDPKVRYYDVVAAERRENEGPGTLLAAYEYKVAPSVDLSSVSTVNFQLIPASYSITGVVSIPTGGSPLSIPFGENGLTAPGALIFLQKSGVLPTKTPIADILVVTDRDGSFTITSLTTGTYKMIISSLGYGSLQRSVTISSISVNMGVVTLAGGASLSGNIKKPDGSSPSQDEIDGLFSVTSNFGEVLFGTLTKDANSKTVTAYTISGFKVSLATAPITYRLILMDSRGTLIAPQEGSGLVFTSTASVTLDLSYRAPKPTIFSKARRVGSDFQVQFELSQPLRNKTADDDRMELLLTTVSAKGSLSQYELSGDRMKLLALYTPHVTESSFTLRLDGRTVVADPDSLDPVNPEYRLISQPTFYIGIDGLNQSVLPNFGGGNLLVEGNAGRITLPTGAFSVDSSSTVDVALRISADTLAKVSTLRHNSVQEANIAALRYPAAAYPEHILRAMAATPPSVSPFSGFYDVLLPLGVRTALSQPVAMTIAYSSTTDPSSLNLYWYNAAANAYVLQQDVTGAPPVIDTVNRTITINVNHFSTFVLFQTNVNVISGATFPGSGIEAYNFPNPFDLSVKTVSTIHPATNQTVRGTMIRFALPSDVSGGGSLRIFTVSGEKIRTIDLGTLAGGNYFYQAWDGRNDSGHDVASGVYLGQVKVGNTSKFFKMALVK